MVHSHPPLKPPSPHYLDASVAPVKEPPASYRCLRTGANPPKYGGHALRNNSKRLHQPPNMLGCSSSGTKSARGTKFQGAVGGHSLLMDISICVVFVLYF